MNGNGDCNFKYFGLLKLLFMYFYATLVTVGAGVYIFKVTFNEIPKDNMQQMNLILGFLIGTALTTFIMYFYGGSQSSSAHNDRDKTIPPGTVVSGTVVTDTHIESVMPKVPVITQAEQDKKDRETLVRLWGEDSAEVKAFDEAIKARGVEKPPAIVAG